MEVQLISLDNIVEDENQPRKRYDAEALTGLADSIRQHGVLQPISVLALPSVNMFRIVTGERRWRAAKEAGLEQIPCLVRENAPDDILTEQLIENVQREDLQPLEKARAVDVIKERLGATNREIGGRLGVSERTVGYLLDLLELPAEIGEQVVASPNRPSAGQVTEKHARFLRQLNDLPDVQSAVVDKIREDRLNTDHTGRLVKAIREKPERADEYLGASSDDLRELFGTGPTVAAVVQSAPSGVPCSFADRILEFIGTLDHFQPMLMSPEQVRRSEEALTSLRMTVDALLRECRLETGDPV